ncbi:transcription initiation factor TFIID component TAF4 family-domain-containing protein [Mycena maculata]|uniref:Transcription initiation factor TFIID subunit 4 n=1 Tax=Mycena maculata TaxID=230809 RepID=A0AAD7MVA5_9AGAR|nr:transcription initiation factor TFIID component TAF4 family-domain-containing protein [Mycena maculata]
MGTPTAPDWNSLIPIDPALQSQSTSQSTPATPYSAYTAYSQQHYQQHTAYQVYQQQAQQQHYTAPSTPAASNDAVADVQAEEEKPRAPAASSRPILDRSRNQPLNPNFDPTILTPRLAAIAAHHQLAGGVPEEVASYIALAVRTRLERLVVQMATAARHRTDTQFDRPAHYAPGAPMWVLAVRSDVAKQTAALERAEREDETRIRRERKERAEMTAAHAAALAAQTAGGGGAGGGGAGMDFDDDEGGRKKKKKDGPGVTARNMSEDVRKKMSNAVATQAAGLGGKYSWMTPGNAAAAAAASAKPVAKAATPSTPSTATTTATTGGGWARAYVPKKTDVVAAPPPPPVEEDTRTAITIRDAQFVVEKERTHGGGRSKG